MVIFSKMIVKKKIQIIFIIFNILFYPLFFSSAIMASSPSFSPYPVSGIIKNRESGFTVDILIDSGEYELNKARMVLNFDPRLIQLTKASRNNSLFAQWPADESTLDNTNGVVMLTGFTQSGSGDMYKTSGDPDVFARLEFEVITEEDTQIVLEWEFTGGDDLFQTVLLTDGSPPYNVLTTRPQNAEFRFGVLSQTAIESKHIPFILGGFLMLTAGIVITSKPGTVRKKFGTVVLYEK
mgnify:CR=1 FL=1